MESEECTPVEASLCNLNGSLFAEEGGRKIQRKEIKMYKKKGAGRLLQMSGPNLHEWQRAKLQGTGGSCPPPPHPALFGGELKGSCDAHDCPSLGRQGSVANEGLWVSTRHFTLGASLTTPPRSPCTPTPLNKPAPLLLQTPRQTGAYWSHR